MSPALVLLVAMSLVAGAPGAASAQGGKVAPGAKPAEPRSATPAHPDELECRNCHLRTHQGVLRMYVGLGGRGTPTIPSHMFQVRVQCVACHTAASGEEPGAAALAGQTFKPSEQACVGCHGEKYRGMLGRWAETLAKMRDIVAPKLAAARAALAVTDAKDGKLAPVRERVSDADHNLRFVALGKGVHNVFYAADLVKLSNSWLDDALLRLGKPRPKADDALVRGGYCAVLCHQQVGVKQRETVTFGKQKVPHVRHVNEFGAVCTACHSAEVHKAVTATAATCASCHHGAENERCESCHRTQGAFFRGQVRTDLVKVEPNVMADAVTCTGCHDWSKKHSRQAVGEKCVGCHDAGYAKYIGQWTTALDTEALRVTAVLTRADAAIARERRKGRQVGDAARLVQEARQALALVRNARGVHNPPASQALLQIARTKAEEALASAVAR